MHGLTIYIVLAIFLFVGIKLAMIAWQNRQLLRGGSRVAAGGSDPSSGPTPAQEALFTATFPELQPCLHPEAAWEYARARRVREAALLEQSWIRPDGFHKRAVERAETSLAGGIERTRLLDPTGSVVAEFAYEAIPEGAVLRIGKGKMTVTLAPRDPRVRYWHPERQFKWSPIRGWTFVTPVVQDAGSTESASAFDDRGPSSSPGTRAAAAAAGATALVAAGGTFDGGGASGGWGEGSTSGTSY